MDERHRLAGAGPWTAAVGRGGQGPGRRARARDTVLINSLVARVRLRRIGSRPRSSAAATTCLRRTACGTHTAHTRPASTPERPRPREYLSRRDVAWGSESDAESERAPVRKGPSPVGLAVAFALAPLTSQQQGRSAAGSPRLLRLAKRRTKLLLFTTSPASRPALPAAGQTSGHSASAVTACVNPHADAGGHA